MSKKKTQDREILWKPNKGPQTRFLQSNVTEVLYGGAAGGGKTDAIVVAPLRWVENPHFRGIIFRRSYPELEKSVIERTQFIYPKAVEGARYNDQKHTWTFPSGAKIYLAHLAHLKTIYEHQSSEYQFVGFDEGTSFLKKQYTYITRSRARSSKGVPIRIRVGTNPGNVGHEWVLELWGPWLDRRPEYKGPIAAPGEVLWYVYDHEGKEKWVPKGTPGALSRTFIPALLRDNPILTKNDPGYAARMAGLDPVERARLQDGNWLVKPGKGLYFKRRWCEVVDAVPAGARWVRYWDLAGTEENDDGSNDPDFTAGVKLAFKDGIYYVAHVSCDQIEPGDVETTLKNTASDDGAHVAIGIDQDPGQAGKHQAKTLAKLLDGYNVRFFAPTGDKLVRFAPFSAQASVGNVKILRGAWNAAYFDELESVPEGSHDDRMDATAGAHMLLNQAAVVDFGVASVTGGRGWRK